MNFHHHTLWIASVSVLSTVSADDSWNQWRGPSRTGEVASQPAWPVNLGEEHLRKIWQKPLAEGYSSPVTSGGKVFTFATKNKESEVVRAFGLETGEQIWEQSWEGAMKVPFFAAKNGSWVRSTPSVHDGAIFVGGMRDVLAKVDTETGEDIWRVDFTERNGTEVPSFGQVCSPLIDGDSVYLQAGLAVAKLSARTGETIWRSMVDERAMFGSAFSSPIIATLAGERQLIVQARLELAGLDLETGDVIWSTPVKAFRGMNILTPTIVDDDKVFVASYGGGSFLFQVERNSKGKFSARQLWNNEQVEGYMGSPIIVDEHVYLHGRDKKLHCLALSDGKLSWSSEEEFGEYWSMIRQGDRILALDQRGELVLFHARPESFEITDRRMVSVDDPTWAHIGMDGSKLLIRSLYGISVWEWK